MADGPEGLGKPGQQRWEVVNEPAPALGNRTPEQIAADGNALITAIAEMGYDIREVGV